MDDYVCYIDGKAVVLGHRTTSRFCSRRSHLLWADAGMPPILRESSVYYIEGNTGGSRFRRSTGHIYVTDDGWSFQPPRAGKVTIAAWNGPVEDVVRRARCAA